MAPPLLLQLGIPVISKILSDVLGDVNHPAARTASDALSSLEDALVKGQISAEQIAEANRHAEYMASLQTEADSAALSDIQTTIRQELTSEDKYIRRMRPTFGYLMAITWTAQMLALAFVMVFRTRDAHLVIESVEALSMIWTVGLSVLGIYVYKRSEDKKLRTSSGVSKPKMIKVIAEKLLDHPADRSQSSAKEALKPRTRGLNS